MSTLEEIECKQCHAIFNAPIWRHRVVCGTECRGKYVQILPEVQKNRLIPLFGKDSPRYGIKHSEETKLKLSIANKGKIPPNKGKSKGWLVRGYKYIQYMGKSIPEHHLIWMKYNKLKNIPEGYIIHHINGKKNDNRIENLIVMQRAEHIALHNIWALQKNPNRKYWGKNSHFGGE